MMIERKKQIFFGTMSSYEKALNLVILNGQADSKADRQTDQPTSLIDV